MHFIAVFPPLFCIGSFMPLYIFKQYNIFICLEREKGNLCISHIQFQKLCDTPLAVLSPSLTSIFLVFFLFLFIFNNTMPSVNLRLTTTILQFIKNSINRKQKNHKIIGKSNKLCHYIVVFLIVLDATSQEKYSICHSSLIIMVSSCILFLTKVNVFFFKNFSLPELST